MLVGTLQQLKDQVKDHAKLKAGLEYLMNFNADKEFADITPENNRKVEIEGDDVFAIIQTYTPKDWDVLKFEGHRKYIDIQCVFGGEEKLLHTGTQRIKKQGEYDEEKDIHFSDVDRFSELLLTNGDACILYPEDMHAPCMKAESDELVKKVVVKVAVENE